MSIVDYIFGNTSKFPKEEKNLSQRKIKDLVSRSKTKSLDQTEELLVEQVIMKRRRGDGKISLFQINEALTKLKNQNKISKFDMDSLNSVFKNYFDNKSKKK
jgi:hypothetical protein